MSIVNFVCCVCVKKNGFLSSVNEAGPDSVKLLEKLRTCAPSQEWTENYQICECCLSKLDEAYNFILQCMKSEKLRDELIQESVVVKVQDSKIQWTCQFCFETFATKASAKRHMLNKHTKEEIPKNTLVESMIESLLDSPSGSSELEEIEAIKTENERFINNEQVQFGLKGIQSKRLPCEYCDETFATKSNVKRHIFRRHKSNINDKELSKNELIIFSSEVKQNDVNEIKNENTIKPELTSKERYPCELCNETFASGSSVRRHIIRRHLAIVKDEEVTENQLEVFTSEEVIEKEEIKIEKEISPLTCKYCRQTFTARSSVRRHIVRHHSSKSNVPTRKFDNDDEWTAKLISKRSRVKSKNGPFKCPHCDELFDWEKDLSLHKNYKHRPERPFHCEKCNATFVKRQNLVVHLKQRHRSDPREYVCSTCSKRCPNQATLNSHIQQKHLNKREFQCEKCGKGFNTKSSLIGHRKVVHIDPSKWPHPCNICNKRFALKSGLDNHIKRHMGIKNVICHICSKCFIDNHDLKKHLVSHSNERSSYPCTMCKDKIFMSTDGFRKHMARHHNIGQYKTPERKFTCHLCPKAFPANNKLQKHIRTHTGERPFVCEHCGKRFIDNCLRKSHILSNHQIVIKRDEFGKELHVKKFTEPVDEDDPVIAYNDTEVEVVTSQDLV